MGTSAVGVSFISLEVGDACHSEINDFDADTFQVLLKGLLKVDQNVVGFDVSMVDTAAMNMIDL